MKGLVLVTGGAGFIGCNLADNLLGSGREVRVYDSLSRVGTAHNIKWLREKWGRKIDFAQGDVRDFDALKKAVEGAVMIYHLAAQVAVTTSVADPRTDFQVNALGTLNVIEAARLSPEKPAVVFASTNKVYGRMEDIGVAEGETRYTFERKMRGIDEDRNLDFHSPYGCSKGAADQYVRDYARIYGVPTVVFRMSCIYGPRQFGNEDQGWVAYFLIAALKNRPLTIYGNGKQVRDILYVGDLVNAFRSAEDRMDAVRGNVYNMGGGEKNTLSLLELLGIMERRYGLKVKPAYADWRPGDQPIYVSDTGRAKRDLDWKPLVKVEDGIEKLHRWIVEHGNLL